MEQHSDDPAALSRTEHDSPGDDLSPDDLDPISPKSAESARRILAEVLSDLGIVYRFPMPEAAIEGTIGTIETTIQAADRQRHAEDGPGIRDLKLLHLSGEAALVEQYEILAALLAGAALEVKTDPPFDDYHRAVAKLPRNYIASLQLGDPSPDGPWVVIIIRSPDMMEASSAAKNIYRRYKATLPGK